MQPSPDYLVDLLGNEAERAAIFAELARSIEVAPRNALAYFIKAYLQEKSGEYEAALQNYQTILEIDPTFYRAAFNLGVIFQSSLKNPQNAEQYYLLAHKLEPTHLLTLNNLAMLYLAQNNYRDGENFLLKAIEVDPNYFSARYNLIQLYKKQNSPQLKNAYQWILNNQHLIPPNRKAIIEEAQAG